MACQDEGSLKAVLTVGQQLKTEREKQNLTLKDVELSTSIRSLYLDAIEKDDFAAVPGEVYLKGFIRNYAIALSLDPEELLAQYKEQVGAIKPVETTDMESKADVSAAVTQPVIARVGLEPQATPTRRLNMGRALLVGGALVVLLGGGLYWFLDNISEQKSTLQATNTVKDKPTIPAAITQKTNSTSQNKTLKLEVTAVDTCWTEVVADGKAVYSGTLQKGQKIQWEAKEMLRIKLGNAGAVQANMNGRALPAFGKTGEVIERVFSLADA